MGRRRSIWFVWMLAALMLYFFENNTGTRAVLLISLLVPLFSVCCARMAAKSVTVSMRVPETVRTGERIRCEMTVSGNRWLAGCTAACTLTGVNRMTGEAFRTEVTAGRKGTAAAEAESSRCGCLFLSVTRAEVRDWFGLTHIVRNILTGVSVIIEPELFPAAVRTEPDYGSCSREAAGSSHRQEDPEPGDMRLYIPGDPIRRIHWKLSEKTGQTLVREASPESLRPVALMLETVFPVKNDPEAMHAAAQGILAVSAALTAEGTAHTVVWADNHEAAAEDIGNEEDFRRMKERLLSAAAGTGGDGTGALFQRQYPEARFQRVIMFSPHPYSDVPLPAAFRPATLVLPPFIPYAGSEPGIRVISLDPADACIAI